MSCRREELAASLLAAAGSIWFVFELTRNFHRIFQVLPPTGGPTETIGLAVLIWLHAKHRRESERLITLFGNNTDSARATPDSPLPAEDTK
jgi:hypothetical protein